MNPSNGRRLPTTNRKRRPSGVKKKGKQPEPEKKQSSAIVALKLTIAVVLVAAIPFVFMNPNISLGSLDSMRKGIFAMEISLSGNKVTPNGFSKAVQLQDVRLVKLYLRSGVDLNQVDNKGISPLCYAAFLGSTDIVKLLLNEDVDIGVKNLSDGFTPIFCAVRSNKPEILTAFVEKGVDVNRRCDEENGITPLHYAAMLGKEASVSFLIKNGANVNIHDVAGRTPLHYAVLQKKIVILHMLLNANADFNLRDDAGSTPFDIAMQSGNVQYVNLLRKRGYLENKKESEIGGFSSVDAMQELQKFHNTMEKTNQ